MKLIDLYKSILDAAGLVADDNGFISVNTKLFTGEDNENKPALIDGKRLVLPTREHLVNPKEDSQIVFHPLNEIILRGESPVVSSLRSYFGIRLSFTIAAIVRELLDICASVNRHKTLDPEQAQVLSIAPDADEGTLRAFSNLTVKVLSSDVSFVKFYLKRSGTINGTKYSRAGILSFPFFEGLVQATDNYLGVKLRKKDKESIIKIFKYILPNIDVADSYNRGSNSDVAPFMDALMKTFMGVAACLNDIVELYKSLDDDFEKLIFNSDWVECFNDLNNFLPEIRKVPSQFGNEGEISKVSQPNKVEQKLNFVPPPDVTTVASNTNQNTVSNHSTGSPDTGRVSFQELMNRSQRNNFTNNQYNDNQFNDYQNNIPINMIPPSLQMEAIRNNPGLISNYNYPNYQQQPGMPRSSGTNMPNNGNFNIGGNNFNNGQFPFFNGNYPI